jgi:hypothetical protein
MSRGRHYDDSNYTQKYRKWFGLGTKWGGEGNPYGHLSSDARASIAAVGPKGVGAGGFFLGTANPGTLTHVEAWRPQGPIEIKKIGVFCCSTMTNASEGVMNFQFLTRGASASVIGTLHAASATVSENTITASKTSLTVTQCKAGEYITIKSVEPTRTGSATEVKATTAGRVAYFVDYVPAFEAGGHWHDSN